MVSHTTLDSAGDRSPRKAGQLASGNSAVTDFDPPAGLNVGEVQITDRLWVVLRSDGHVDVVFAPDGVQGEKIAEGLTVDEARALSSASGEFADRLERMTAGRC